MLRCPVGEPVFFIQRLRHAGRTPLLTEKRYICASAAPSLLNEDLHSDSVHELVLRLGVPLTRVEQSLSPVNLHAEEAQLLHVPSGTAAFLMRRRAYSAEMMVCYTNYWIRGDQATFHDRFEP